MILKTGAVSPFETFVWQIGTLKYTLKHVCNFIIINLLFLPHSNVPLKICSHLFGNE
jgi:hypothetical protein